MFHRPSSVGQKLSNEPANEMALHLWTMTEMRWNRKAVSLGSPEDADKRRPKQAKNLSPLRWLDPRSQSRPDKTNTCVWAPGTCHSSILRLSLMQPHYHYYDNDGYETMMMKPTTTPIVMMTMKRWRCRWREYDDDDCGNLDDADDDNINDV